MKNISTLVDSLWNNLELDKIEPRHQALVFWEKAVGKKLASYCSLEGFSLTTLSVQTSNPAVAMELKYCSSEILKKMNALAGSELFLSLVVNVKPHN